jgi:hypothetical protein
MGKQISKRTDRIVKGLYLAKRTVGITVNRNRRTDWFIQDQEDKRD